MCAKRVATVSHTPNIKLSFWGSNNLPIRAISSSPRRVIEEHPDNGSPEYIMGKRARDPEDCSPHGKRRRLTPSSSSKTSPEDVSSLKQLQDLLAFNQDAGPNAKQSVNFLRARV